jgi:hypothetical protein
MGKNIMRNYTFFLKQTRGTNYNTREILSQPVVLTRVAPVSSMYVTIRFGLSIFIDVCHYVYIRH